MYSISNFTYDFETPYKDLVAQSHNGTELAIQISEVLKKWGSIKDVNVDDLEAEYFVLVDRGDPGGNA
ncbi:hypothetical protein MKW98_008854 [Papaver atlanticum]|uniref:Uncharacterized protein n=1 Tax=Papaver atlanticum TaxID=357466 RepID=A0AAD4XAA7_9MAGN|nr:hypothetical protein MKW98_008854 [Papaver atlanticum]